MNPNEDREFEGLPFIAPPSTPPVRGGAAYRIKPRSSAAAKRPEPPVGGGQVSLTAVGILSSPSAVGSIP